MTEVWTSLGKARLEKLIGEDVLTRLERLLPALKPELTPLNIYSTRGLSSIFDSFAGGAAQLEDPSFRDEVFNALTPERMSQLLKAVGYSGEELEWGQKVQVLTKAWQTRTTAEKIVAALGISPDLLPEEVSLRPDTLLVQPATKPYKALKDYQYPVLCAALQRLESPLARFVVQMPTGSGKTRTAMEIVTQALNDQPAGTIVIWLAHSEELCEQAYDSFEEVWTHVAQRPLQLVRSWGAKGALRSDFADSAFIVGSFAKLYGRLKKEPKAFLRVAARSFLLVVDEAHKIIAPSYTEVCRALMGHQTRVMGLTATPGRSVRNEEENAKLAEFFFREIDGKEDLHALALALRPEERGLSQGRPHPQSAGTDPDPNIEAPALRAPLRRGRA